MLYNNLKIALRTLGKNKIYTFINIFGLTIGIAAVLLIFRMVNYELSFNKNFTNYDNLYRVVHRTITPTEGEKLGFCMPLPAMESMRTDVSQFVASARFYEMFSNLTVPNPTGGAPLKKFAIENGLGYAVDPEFFTLFDFKLLAGDKETVLNEPNTIVLTKDWAEKCFDSWENAIGKTVSIDNLIDVKVTGVLDETPSNCDLKFPYLVSYITIENNSDLFYYGGGWGSCSSNNQMFALLKNKKQQSVADEVLATIGAEEYTRDGEQKRFFHLQALSTIHYDEDYGNSGSYTMSMNQLKVLGFIGLLILIIACFNFINLATAQATLRAKEVGVRKTLGSRPIQLIRQFMTETGVIVIIAVILGANLATLASPLLKHVSDVPDELPFLTQPIVLGFLAITAIVVTLLSGLYPAFTLSRYQPMEALRSKVSKESFAGVSLRKSLVVLQFAIAQALIIGSVITINQLDFIQNRDLGFTKELVYTFNIGSDSTTIARQTALKQSILQIPEVESVSMNSDQPFSGSTWASNFRYSTRPEDEKFHITQKFTDEDYMKTYGLRLLAGKWLMPSDTSRQCVVNMTTLRKLGVTDPKEAIGQNILIGQTLKLPIVGVTEDFHTKSLHADHEPLLMTTKKDFYWEAGIKLRSGNVKNTIASIKNKFDAILPEQVFTGTFFDDNIQRFYQNDQRISATCKGFGLIAILISCLGLFGLATHSATQRIKEIGIRKVLGASVPGIIGLLSKDFLKLVLIALIIAAPLAWYGMSKWLENFVFRTDISWEVFLIAGIAAMAIAFLTVAYQAVKAAISNPIKALKTE